MIVVSHDYAVLFYSVSFTKYHVCFSILSSSTCLNTGSEITHFKMLLCAILVPRQSSMRLRGFFLSWVFLCTVFFCHVVDVHTAALSFVFQVLSVLWFCRHSWRAWTKWGHCWTPPPPCSLSAYISELVFVVFRLYFGDRKAYCKSCLCWHMGEIFGGSVQYHS